MALGVSAKAEAAEKAAFTKLGRQLNGRAIVSPAGFDAGFPDFAYRIQLENGKTVDLHFEYKADYKAQMGSMRDWIFDGRKFVTMDTKSESKQELLAVMNNTPKAVQNAKRLLSDLKKYFSPQVKQLYSGSLTVIRDKDERRVQTQEFAKNTDNYQIAAISDRILGNKILDHYKTKFKKNLKSGNDASILFMMLKDKVWMVDRAGSVTSAELVEVAKRLGLDNLDSLENLTAKLEVRIQPRGLNSPGKPTSIDVMASFRLAQAPAGGGKVI
jgi:hypothetical protein